MRESDLAGLHDGLWHTIADLTRQRFAARVFLSVAEVQPKASSRVHVGSTPPGVLRTYADRSQPEVWRGNV